MSQFETDGVFNRGDCNLNRQIKVIELGKSGKMKQTQSVKLHNYWSEIYSETGIPERSQIEPMAIRDILGDTFILEFDADNNIIYRLAGTRLCAVFGKELKSIDFTDPWQDADREAINNIVSSAAIESTIAVFGSVATSNTGRSISIETLVLPLLQNGQKSRRMLGVTTPIIRPYWLGMDPITKLSLSSLRIIAPEKQSGLLNTRFSVVKNKPANNHNPEPLISYPRSKKVKHLTVLEGGLSNIDRNPEI